MVVPSLPFPPGPADRGLRWSRCRRKSLRRAALDARKAYVRTLRDGERACSSSGLPSI